MAQTRIKQKACSYILYNRHTDETGRDLTAMKLSLIEEKGHLLHVWSV